MPASAEMENQMIDCKEDKKKRDMKNESVFFSSKKSIIKYRHGDVGILLWGRYCSRMDSMTNDYCIFKHLEHVFSNIT